MTIEHPRARFPLGATHITSGALDLLDAAGVAPAALLARHVARVWIITEADRSATLLLLLSEY